MPATGAAEAVSRCNLPLPVAFGIESVNRYAAKLLFQFKVTVGGNSGKRRLCEERIIVLKAASAKDALRTAKRRGRQGEHSYLNGDGDRVSFEFVGVMDLMHLGPECEEDEVWYEIKEKLLPFERKNVLIPPERELNAIRLEDRFGIES